MYVSLLARGFWQRLALVYVEEGVVNPRQTPSCRTQDRPRQRRAREPGEPGPREDSEPRTEKDTEYQPASSERHQPPKVLVEDGLLENAEDLRTFLHRLVHIIWELNKGHHHLLILI